MHHRWRRCETLLQPATAALPRLASGAPRHLGFPRESWVRPLADAGDCSQHRQARDGLHLVGVDDERVEELEEHAQDQKSPCGRAVDEVHFDWEARVSDEMFGRRMEVELIHAERSFVEHEFASRVELEFDSVVAVNQMLSGRVVAERHGVMAFGGAAGILEDVNDPNSLISYIDRTALQKLRDSGSLADGMLPKAAAIDAAISNGVQRVHIISSKLPDSILLEVFTNEGTGTLVVDDIGGLTPAEQSTAS